MNKKTKKQLIKWWLLSETSTRLKLQAFILLCIISFSSYSQTCLWTTQSPSGTINVSSNSQTMVGLNIFSGTYSVENFTVAGQYIITTSTGCNLTVTDNLNKSNYFRSKYINNYYTNTWFV
jgi:hypothetical protein